MLGRTPGREETDQALRVMSHTLRRRLLFELYVGVSQRGRERVSYDDIQPFGTRAARVQLLHAHLPKLEDYGYITWNESEKTISEGPRWGEIEPILELIYTHLNELPPSLQGTRATGGGTPP